MSSRLYCKPKALWKLNWFLRDFGYDTDLLGRDEVDEKVLIGLEGVVKVSHVVINGTSLHRFDGFARSAQWEELSPGNLTGSEVASWPTATPRSATTLPARAGTATVTWTAGWRTPAVPRCS